MQLKSLIIKNFRSFKNIKIELNKKNIILGVNNVGKSNLIFAIRLLLDKELWNYELQETDFFEKNINENIEIAIEIEYNIDNPDDDTKKILSLMKNAVSNDKGLICMKLILRYNSDDNYKEWQWGNDFIDIETVPSINYFSPLYKLFSVIYIPANASIDEIYKKEKNNFFRKYTLTNNEISDSTNLNKTIDVLNTEISNLPKIQEIKTLINNNLKKFDSGKYEVTLESEIKVKGVNSQLKFFMKDKKMQSDTYPIAGDGIKKKVSYAFLDVLKNDENESKIIIHLFEEPENYLFYSSHFDLANKLLNSSCFVYVFIVTHSPMYINNSFSRDANIIKLIKKSDSIIGKSVTLEIPIKTKNLVKKFVQDLAVAFFYDKVLLVEGYSEELLFNFILEKKKVDKEKIYVLKVLSANFEPYFRMLNELDIKCFIKTDNDIRIVKDKLDYLGFNRCIDLYNLLNEEKIQKLERITKNDYSKNKDVFAEMIYNENLNLVDKLINNNIWISTKDLEEDILQAIGSKRFENIMSEFTKKTNKEFIEWFKNKKWHNMADFIENIQDSDIEKIINSKPFSFFKELLKND